MRDWLLNQFAKGIPGEKTHLEFSPMRGLSSEIIKNFENYRISSVALVCYPKDDYLGGVLIQRQAYEGTHSAQVSFPGGKQEQSDRDEIETAIRECSEEIGLFLEREQFIGQLSDVFIPVSGFLVKVNVFYLDDEPTEFTPSDREVAKIYTFNYKELFKADAKFFKDLSIGANRLNHIPHFKLQEAEIWGATAIMLNEFKHLLLQ